MVCIAGYCLHLSFNGMGVGVYILVLPLLCIVIIIIIIMAGMAVFLRGWLPHRGEAQMAYNYCFPTRTMF